ncbi:c-type cytochrome [Roseovarius aestuariivivens]|uniref:c-type cytochrome n=1 Tax=Roseovarius aestuariivivens TaxID=1888910 RepID=UPI0010805E5C|nr:c-type cytochrome [Roseovarius aestuariivivens]
MRRIALFGLGGICLAGIALAETPVAGDPAEGRKLANQCRTCHGLDGYAKIPVAPHIGGEPAPYITSQLTAFRNGTRRHEMMSVVASTLSDQQIADLAAWYASHDVTATLRADVDGAPEQCTACHGADGLSLADDVPNLAGETNIYIETQLKAFRTGKRKHEVMTPMALALSEDEMRAVADWYGNVKISIDMAE